MRKRKFYVAIILMIFGIMFLQSKESKAETCEVNGTTYVYDIVDGNAENVYIYNENGTYSGNVTIPETLNGHTVRSIGDGRHNVVGRSLDFSGTYWPETGVLYGKAHYCSIRNLELPNTLKSINSAAFYGIQFDNVYTIPDGVEYIGNYAFANVNIKYNSNRTITIPDSVQSIGDYAFANESANFVKGDKLNSSSSYFYWYWLKNPIGMNDIKLGSGVTTIGKYAFLNQKELKEVTIPLNVTEIGEGAFIGTEITALNIQGETSSGRAKTLKIGDYAFKDIPLEHFKVLESYEMGSYVFKNSNLKQVEFGEGVTSIPEGICYNCKNLTNITKTNSVTEIKSEAFLGCSAITTEEYHDIATNVTTIGDRAFYDCKGLTGNVEIKEIVTSLGTYVFSNCSNIETVEIKANLTEIPAGTFSYCTSLRDVTKPNSITSINDNAFNRCTSLTTEEYHDIITNITTIGNGVFGGCTGLTGNVEIKEIVTSLGTYVFSDCSNIETVEIKANLTEIPAGTFKSCTSLKDITKKDSVVAIGDEAFYGCTNLTIEEYNDIAKNIARIGKKAFYNCTGMKGDLTINNIVTYIGQSSFENCTGISNVLFEKVNYENSTELAIEEKAFYKAAQDQEAVKIYCKNLTVGPKAFSNIYEAFIYCEDKDTTKSYNWYGNISTGKKCIVHYLDCTHNIDITCNLPGVTLVNPTTGEAVETTNINCEDNFTFKLVIQDEYKEKYKDLCIKVVSEGQYSNSNAVEEYITLNEDNIYTLNQVNRNKKIVVQQKQEGTDLVLRQYISEKNGKALVEKRKVSEKVENAKLAIINYNHTKYPLAVRKSDKLTYVVRAYNEGKVEGQVNEITVRIGDGLKFAQGNSINDLYGWTLSDDGKTIKTTYLKDKPIESYSNNGKPNYQEIQYVLEVIDYSDIDKYTVTLAEISNGNDIDSLGDSISNIDLTDYMKDACYTSSVDTYLQCEEDDTDIEAVLIEGKPQVEYNLVVNKIDSLSNELLNGAKIQLLNENKEIIKTAITEDGTINFGSVISYGEGTDLYYLDEVETPTGYLRTMEGMIELQVIKTLNDDGDLEVEIVVDIQNKEDEVNNATIEEDIEYIPIQTEEQLRKIGSNESIEVNGKTYEFKEQANYQLQNDIGLTSPFTPINHMNGVFDGNNHTISNLSITEENTLEIGMFRTFSGTIMNLNITEANISGASTVEGKEAIYNQPATGVLVGYMESGIIKDVNITATVTSSLQNVGGFIGHTHENGTVEFKDCTSNGLVGGSYNVGGFVGCAKGKIIMNNCTKNGSFVLTSSNYNLGGLIGVAENDVTVDNCTVHGATMSEDISYSIGANIGGLIGYTSAGNTIMIRKSENKGTTMGYHNVGGIVGYNESVINILECTHEGQIAGGDNSGGIIGYSKVTGDAPANAIVGFDNNSKTITLNIKNKQTESEYKININKVDLSLEKGKQGLSGAKFNIYDKNKQLIQENSEVDDDGYLTLNNITINSLTEDVYFIKEVDAPKGYDILIKDYIKLEITKTWDGVNERYIIEANSDVVNEPDDVETEEDNTKTGTTAEKLTYTNIRYKTNKTAIQNCTNIGGVSGYATSGGIAGSIRGYCLIDDCNNESGSITANGSFANSISGGIVGDIAVNTKDDEAIVSNCKNNAAVLGSRSGGIVGITGSTIEINNCENTGAVVPYSGSANSGGIVGEVYKRATIDNCMNTAQVVGNHAGGIVGSAISALDDYAKDVVGFHINCEYIEITNCNVSDCEIQGTPSNSAGIIAGAFADECIIRGNSVENADIKLPTSSGSGNSVSGIIATTREAGYIEIEDCDVISSTITGGRLGTAGIIGAFTTANIYDGVGSSVSGCNSEVRINNCNIYGGNINAGRSNAAGILSEIGWESKSILITNCGVHSDDQGNPCRISAIEDQAVGIVRRY